MTKTWNRSSKLLAFAVAAISSLSLQLVQAQDFTAYDVMKQVDDRYNGDSSIGEYTMVLIDRRERQRVRNLKIYSKDYDEDNKALSLFESPADIRGTAYLNFDWDHEARSDEYWLFLPACLLLKRSV